MTWRQVRAYLQNMQESKLNGEALVYLPGDASSLGEPKILELSRFTTIDGDLAEEFDLVEDDPLLLIA